MNILGLGHINRIGKAEISAFIMGLLVFFETQPYYFWSISTKGLVSVIVPSLIFLLAFLNGLSGEVNKRSNIVGLFLLVIGWGFIASGSNLIGLLVGIIGMVPLCALNENFCRKSYNAFYSIYVIIMALSLLNVLLVFIGVSLPSQVISPLNELKSYNYIAYPFLVTPAFPNPKFFGVYDEPGVVGTLSIIILGIEKLDFKKRGNWVVLATGILSMSLFFYIMFVFLFAARSIRKGEHAIRRLVWGVIVILGIYALISIEGTVLYEKIGARLIFDDETGLLAGDNRYKTAQDFVYYYDQIKWSSPIFYLGSTLGGGNLQYIADLEEGASGYKMAVVQYGLFFCAFYLLFFYNYARRNIRDKFAVIVFIISMMMTYYQRPAILYVPYLFLFFAWAKLYNKEEIQ